MKRHLFHGLGLLGATAVAFSATASAQTIEQFYKSKPLTLIVASGAGGGYDVYARLWARHLPKHLPGKPNIIVQNMEGAGGLVSTNHLANRAERDGSVILATFNAMTLQPLIDSQGVQFDPRQLNWIGSMGKQQSICVTWKDRSPIKTLDDAIRNEVTVASTGVTNNNATVPNILNSLAKTRFKVIYGYTTATMRLSIQNGEVDGICGLAFSTLMASDPDWILNKRLNILAQFAKEKVSALPDVPLAAEYIKAPNDLKVLDVLTIPQEMGRPIVAPPGVPADRVAALRKAMDESMKDPEFLEEAKRAHLIIEPISGQQIHNYIEQIYATPSDIVKRAADLLNTQEAKQGR